MDNEVGKVIAFIVRQMAGKRQVLVIRHRRAGNQLPNGAVEANETPEDAVLREVREQTGLADVEIAAHLETVEQVLEGNDRVLTEPNVLELEPGDSARGIARLKRGSFVQVIENWQNYTRACAEFVLENGVLRPDEHYAGWLLSKFLTNQTRWYLFQVKTTAPTADQWTHKINDFRGIDCQWADMNVELIPPHQAWLDRVRDRLES